jgi:tripartite-type tricarboxylate transporter receptor subunit TctC
MLFAPGKTPDAIADRLNAAVREALAVPAVAGVMQRDGYVPDNRSAADTEAFFRKEVATIGEAVKAAKIEPN